MMEDEGFPTVDEVVPRPGKARTDLKSPAEDEFEPVISTMDAATLTMFKTKWRIPDHIELVPAGRDIVHIHRPGYCVFYAYPFVIGYMLPLPSLVVDFCHFYEVCPA